MRSTIDMGAIQLVVKSEISFDMLRTKSAEYQRMAKRSKTTSDDKRIYMAVAHGLEQLAHTAPNIGMSHAQLQVYVRTVNGHKRPLSRTEQEEVMKKIVGFVFPIMEMDGTTTTIRSKRYTGKKPTDETTA